MAAIWGSEFVWGIVIGLLVALAGAWAQAEITTRKQRKHERTLVRDFCIDLLKNLQGIVAELERTRDRTKAIFHDYLGLIDVEVQTFGRNREHLDLLPDDKVRVEVRQFIADIALRRIEVMSRLEEHYKPQGKPDRLPPE